MDRKNYIFSNNSNFITPFHIGTFTLPTKKTVGNVMLKTLFSYEINAIENNPKNYGWNLDDPNPGVYDLPPPLLKCPQEHKV